MSNPLRPEPLDLQGQRNLANALGDTPETAISVHLLRRGLCRAYAAGDPEDFDAALIQAAEDPGEPTAFGDDAHALWDLLRPVEGWWCVNVPASLTPELGKLMEQDLRRPARLCGDVYHTLARPAPPVENSAVRLLALENSPLVEAAPAEVRGTGFGSPRALLSEGIVVGAVISGELAAIAFTSAMTDLHADISIATLEGWRGRGLATAAASLVIRRVQDSGRVPVWSAGENNLASLKVARKLGFEERSRRTYVIPNERR